MCSGPRPPQHLVGLLAAGRAPLLSDPRLFFVGSPGIRGRSPRLGALGRGRGERWDAQPVAGLAHQEPQQRAGRVPEKNGAGGVVRVAAPLRICTAAMWAADARSQGGLERGSRQHTFPVRAQEPRRPLQAAGEAVLEGVRAAHAAPGACLLPLRLQEEDGVLQDLRLLHPALRRLL